MKFLGATVENMTDVQAEHRYPNRQRPEKVKKMEPFKCVVCGKDAERIKRSMNARLTCSEACRRVYHPMRARPNPRITRKVLDKNCKTCGKAFETKTKGRKFCSNSCSTIFQNRKRHKRVTVFCRGCREGFEVVPSRISQKYCSVNCMEIHLYGRS